MSSFVSASLALLPLLLIIFPVFGEEVPCAPVAVRTCPGVDPSPRATLVGVYIQGCFEEPCSFYKNQKVTMEMDIDFHEAVPTMKAELHALLGGFPVKWDGINPNACQDIVSDGDCPFKEGDYITYGVDLFIEPAFPTVRTDVRYWLLDENGDKLICWIVKAQVQ